MHSLDDEDDEHHHHYHHHYYYYFHTWLEKSRLHLTPAVANYYKWQKFVDTLCSSISPWGVKYVSKQTQPKANMQE